MEAKHTPGPWEITNDIEEEKVADVVAENGGVYIRAQWGAKSRLAKGEKAALIAELTANARLIAAAPDLLAALVELRTWVGNPSSNAGEAELKQADAAIAKAVV